MRDGHSGPVSWTDADVPPQTVRTALVTGASSGLGLASTVALARVGARVLMAVRDPARGEAALARVRAEVPDARAELVRLDLASLRSVAAAADDVASHVESLDLLLATTRASWPSRGRSPRTASRGRWPSTTSATSR